jgi:electron transfer flavoprotein beta subunit
MNIVVCIKQIEHIYNRSGMDPAQHFLTAEDQIVRINPYDEAALEAALRIKDRVSGTRIILLTAGTMIAETELRRCLALGADALYRIDTDSNLDPYTKSKQLTSVARRLGADLILCGKESMDRQNGLIGAFMATQLKYPFVSAIVDIEYFPDENRVVVVRSCGRGVREKIGCRLPLVLSVDMGMFTHRVPEHDALKKASETPIQMVSGFSESITPAISILKTMPPRPRTMKIPAPDSSLPAIERIEKLLKGSKIEKKGQILEGDPEVLVAGIINYLAEHGFIDEPIG